MTATGIRVMWVISALEFNIQHLIVDSRRGVDEYHRRSLTVGDCRG